MTTKIVFGVSLVILLCVLSTKFSYKLGVPALIFFMFVGMLFGTDGIMKIAYEDFSSAQIICSISLIFIMLEGGFNTKWSTARKYVPKAVLMSTLGVVLTALFTTLCCHFFLKLSLAESFLIASVLASTDAASVFAILKSNNLDLKDGTSPILEVESGSNDPMAYLLTITAIGIMLTGKAENIFITIVIQLVVGFVSGIAFAALARYVLSLKNIVVDGLDTIFIISVTLLCYALTDMLGGNAYLSVYLLGLTLGNMHIKAKAAVVAFFSDLTSLLQMLIFFIIGLLSTPSGIPQSIPLAFFIIVILTFVARPLATILLLMPLKCSLRQCLLISWAGLRGASSIVFAITAVSAGVALSMDLFHVVFMVSLFSIAIQGALLPTIAIKLKMIDESPNIAKTLNDFDTHADFQFTRLVVDDNSSWIGKRIKDVGLPLGSQAVMIRRDGKNLAARGKTVIERNDEIILNVPAYTPSGKERVKELLIGKDHPWANKKVEQLGIPDNELIIMLQREDQGIVPNGDTLIQAGDVLQIYQGE